MTIILPDYFKALQNGGRAAFQPRERIGSSGEQATVVENDHYLRARGNKRNGLAPSIGLLGGLGFETTTNGFLFYTANINLTDGRQRLKFWTHFHVRGTLGAPCDLRVRYEVFNRATSLSIYTYNTPSVIVTGHQLVDDHTTPNLAATDVYVEVTASFGLLTGTLNLLGSSIFEDGMTVAEL